MGIKAWVTVLYSLLFLAFLGAKGDMVKPINGVLAPIDLCNQTIRYADEQCVQLQAEKERKQKEIEEKKKKEEADKKEYLQALLQNMTVEEKIAQMMIMTHEKDMTYSSVEKNQPGGIIFFGFDFKGKTVAQVRQRVDDLQTVSKIPMLICVDEEGGKINRIDGIKDSTRKEFEAARVLGNTMDAEYLCSQTSEKCALLKELGLNVNFDPVADITTNANAYMYQRSSGSDAAQVCFYVENVVNQMKQENMISCLKHFPGYGNYGNTHVNYIVDTRSLADYEASDFLPFKTGIAQGTDMIMVSHLVMKCFDKKTPASLSKKAHNYIRKELCFDGVIITDDLNMAAVMNRMDLATASKKAVEAGNDMLFSADIDQSILGIKKGLEEGSITIEQIDTSVYRILDMKYTHQMIERSKK